MTHSDGLLDFLYRFIIFLVVVSVYRKLDFYFTFLNKKIELSVVFL